MHRRNDRTDCFVAGAGRDALPRVRRGTARRFFLPLCIRALALSGLRPFLLASTFLTFAPFFGRATPDAQERIPTIATASFNQIIKPREAS